MGDIIVTKTAQGFVPFARVERVAQSGSSKMNQSGFSFQLISSGLTDLSAREKTDVIQGSCSHFQPPQTNLVELAACMKPQVDSDGQGWMPDYQSLYGFAEKVGPLFGDDFSNRSFESSKSWAYAAYAAFLAVRMQECANGRSPVTTLKTLNMPAKRYLVEKSTGKALTLYQLIFRAVDNYAQSLKHLEFIARPSVQNEAFFYTFIQCESSKADAIVSVTIVRLEQELTRRELSYLCRVMDLTSDDERRVTSQLGFGSGEGGTGLFSDQVPYEDHEAPLVEDDLPALAYLVQALILVHIRDIRVDIFRGDRKTGYLTFGSFLSWLWYDFSSDLGTSSIGYCNNCGRPFSLVGHRGMDRLYCSRACKTEAKNAKVRANRERVRKLFLKGWSVAQIASEVYSGSGSDEKRVRSDLSKWVELKHRVDDSIQHSGFQGSELFKRCVEEQLNMNQLLFSKRLSELKELARKSSL